MATRYIEVRDGETWRSVSNLFSDWILARPDTEGFGWSEGDALSLATGTLLLCFKIPDKHGAKIGLFTEWAETTDRLYGIVQSNRVTFPRMHELVVPLSTPKEMPLPPWLR